MIRAGLRLLILYFLAWFVSLQWDGAFQFVRGLIRALLGLSGQLNVIEPAPGSLQVFLAFGLIALLWGLAQLPLWISAVPVRRLSGPIAHPFKRQPLRRHLRFTPSRFLVAIWLQMFGLMVLLRVLQASIQPGTVLAQAGFDSGLIGLFHHLSGRDVWLLFGLIHLLFMVVVWLGLFASNELASKTEREDYGFFRYQLEQAPISRKAMRIIAFGLFPVAAVAANSHSHPLHVIVVVAALCALVLVIGLAQVITLMIEAGHQRWLNRLDAGWQDNPAVRQLRERSIRFLHPRMEFVPEPSAPIAHSQADQLQDAATATDPWSGPSGYADQGVNEDPAATIDARRESTNDPDAGPDLGSDLPDDFADELPDEFDARAGRRPGFARALRLWMVGFAAMLLLAVGAFAWQWMVLPSGDQTRLLARSAHVHLRKSGGSKVKVELLGTRYDYSLNTRLENISAHFVNAVVASEDHRFFEHGVTYKLSKFIYAGIRCVGRALNPWLSTNGCRGNSTIGQQLARNLFISEERSLIRKFKELVWAVKMEFQMTKQEILEAYLNRIYLGDGNFGVEMAARSYFGKSAAALNIHESALLAAAVKRPGWNWHQDREGAMKRARIIFLTMRRYGYAPASASFPKDFAPRIGARPLLRPYLGHLWQFVQPEVQQVMAGLADGDYKVLTSLNAEVQVYARRRLTNAIHRLQAQGVAVSQGAAVVMRPNGAVLAMVGGIGDDLRGRGINRANRTEGLLSRPPASTFKPVLYLAALEKGFKADSKISGHPVQIPIPGGPVYTPVNHDGKTYGTVTVNDGLVNSINTVAVNLLHDHVGFDAVINVAQRLGINPAELERQWGLALGQSGVPVVTMAGAYAAFANGGYRVNPHAFLAITDEDGKSVWQRARPLNRRVFKREAIGQLNVMLERVLRDGTGARARRNFPDSVRLAGKTGTGDNFVDAWFIGYGADIVIAVWMGNDRPQSMTNLYGGGAPAQVFNEIVSDLYKHTNLVSLQTPLP